MADPLGVSLAVVGVLGQLFNGCVQAYSVFTAVTNFDADSQRVVCKIRIEEMRLLVWGRAWGITEGHLEKHLKQQDNPAMTKIAKDTLTELKNTITDFRRLRDQYGLVEEGLEGAGAKPEEGGQKLGVPVVDSYGNGNGKRESMGRRLSSKAADKAKSWGKDIAMKTKWVIADKEKFNALLKDLKDLNDGLEGLFPPSRLAGLQRTWMHELLQSAQRDVNELDLLENASNGVYPKLNASAGLKKLRINLDTKPQASFKPTFAYRVQRPSLTVSDKDPKRSEGFHEPSGSTNVIIEWVDYDKEDLDERMVHMRRLDDLARMMHSATDRHPDLHTIDCLGYTDDKDKSRYGLIYKAPLASYSTLHTLISSNDLKTPDLNERIALAQTLAVALWSLHSLDWLHKSICSNNILFFPSAFSASATQSTASAAMVPDISAPFLVGFDASRPNFDTEMSVASKNPSILDLHRHPQTLSGLSRKPYCKGHDIYSLGLVLLEIGLWKVLQTYYKPHYSAEKWHDRIILPQLVPGLGNRTGRLYREVVERCLTAKDDMTNEEAGQLMEYVVASLESINI